MTLDWIFLPREKPLAEFYITVITIKINFISIASTSLTILGALQIFKATWHCASFRLQKIQLVNVQSSEEVNRRDEDIRSGEKTQLVEYNLAREISFPFASIGSNSKCFY